MPVEGRKFFNQSSACKTVARAQTQKLSKVLGAEGDWGGVPWGLQLCLGILGI